MRASALVPEERSAADCWCLNPSPRLCDREGIVVVPPSPRFLPHLVCPVCPPISCDRVPGQASENDRFVALQLLKNASIAASRVLPSCQVCDRRPPTTRPYRGRPQELLPPRVSRGRLCSRVCTVLGGRA
jgi:hypothetical protein